MLLKAESWSQRKILSYYFYKIESNIPSVFMYSGGNYHFVCYVINYYDDVFEFEKLVRKSLY